MKKLMVLPLLLICTHAMAGPIDIALDPSPQEFANTCQSYSLGLAMTFSPNSPIKADTQIELRNLERQLRVEIVRNWQKVHPNDKDPNRDDWKEAVEKLSSNALTLQWKSFNHVDDAMRFVGSSTGITSPETLGTVLSVAVVKTPVMLSFKKIESSDYRGAAGTGSHIVTVFGVQLPPATMTDDAHPKLLLVNSAVKFLGGKRNICSEEALSDDDRYSAVTTLTDNYVLYPHGAKYFVTYIVDKN